MTISSLRERLIPERLSVACYRHMTSICSVLMAQAGLLRAIQPMLTDVAVGLPGALTWVHGVLHLLVRMITQEGTFHHGASRSKCPTWKVMLLAA